LPPEPLYSVLPPFVVDPPNIHLPPLLPLPQDVLLVPPAAAAALALAELLIEDEDLEPDEPLDDLPPDDPLDLQSTSWSCETASTASRQMAAAAACVHNTARISPGDSQVVELKKRGRHFRVRFICGRMVAW
jgi:hypothetical protein